MPGLHDARPRAGDDHEARVRNFPREFDRLLVFGPARLRARGAENRHFAGVGVRRKKLERVAQFTNRRLNDAHVAAVFDIVQQLERVLNHVLDQVGVVSAALVGNQLLNAALEFGVNRWFVPLFHAREVNGLMAKCNSRAGSSAGSPHPFKVPCAPKMASRLPSKAAPLTLFNTADTVRLP